MLESSDFKHNVYVKCSCLPKGEKIEIPRPNKTGYIPFICPNCGDILGIVVLSKKDFLKKFDKLKKL